MNALIRDQVVSAIKEYSWAGVRLDSGLAPNQVRVAIGAAELLGFADYLHDRFDARPELVFAEDNRSQAGGFTVRYVFELPGLDVLVLLTVQLDDGQMVFPSLAGRSSLAGLFEREIHDLFGLVPLNHPDLRRLFLHPFWPDEYHPLVKGAASPPFRDEGDPFPFEDVEGRGVFQVAVGPVRSGTGEPAHFRLHAAGETIVGLEPQLSYLHKGIEKLFESMPPLRAVELAERVSGDSAVAHALAFSTAVERCAGVEVPDRAAHLRVVFQELERLYNHVADTGAVFADAGFAIPRAHTLRLREDLLRLNERLTGSRLLRGAIVPGGIGIKELTAAQVSDCLRTIHQARTAFDEAAQIGLENPLVVERLSGTGVLSADRARDLQVTGIAARGSGISIDTRRDHPYAAYGRMSFRVPVSTAGDVLARVKVRIEEVHESIRLIVQAFEKLPKGKLSHPMNVLPAGTGALGLVEGGRGAVWYWVSAGAHGTLARVKIKDPSFANWQALEHAAVKNNLADFPACVRSFSLSAAANDL